MTFKKRDISVSLTLASGAINSSGDITATLEGFRMHAIIQQPGGGTSPSRMILRIWGVPTEVMSQFSTEHLLPLAVRYDSVSVSSQGFKVFEGTITSAIPNYMGAPDICFEIQAQTGFIIQAKPAAANSFKGTVKVSDILKAIIEPTGLKLIDHGVTATLNNQYLSDTTMRQIDLVVRASRIGCNIVNNEVHVWPNGSYINNELTISPETGLAGYPTWENIGINVQHEFIPTAFNGSKVTISGSHVSKANGEWQAAYVEHLISAELPDGPFYTNMFLSPTGYYIPR